MDVTGAKIAYANPTLDKKYEKASTIYNSLDYKLGKSTLEGMALLGNSGNAVVKGVATVDNVVSTTIPTLSKVVNNPIVENTAIGLGANGTLQLLTGQEFNWYEFGGAGLASGVTHGMSLRNLIRTNMGISMGVSLISGGNPLQDTTLAGVGALLGTKIKHPIISPLFSETIQKLPYLVPKDINDEVNNEK